jgi:hypothetical protein
VPQDSGRHEIGTQYPITHRNTAFVVSFKVKARQSRQAPIYGRQSLRIGAVVKG